MKKFVPLCLSVALLISAFAFLSVSSVKAQIPGLVSAAVSRMEKNQRSLKSLRANISLQKYNSQLRDTDSQSGIVLYMPGGAGKTSAFMRLEWTRPKHEILVTSNGNYTAYQPRLGQAFEGKTAKIKNDRDSDVLSLINMSAAQLRARFGEFQDVREETLGGGVWTQHFRALPKGPAGYKYIEVWVDKDGMPVMMKMVEKNDDSTTIRLSNVERNPSIPMDQFKLKLDSSVKIIKG